MVIFTFSKKKGFSGFLFLFCILVHGNVKGDPFEPGIPFAIQAEGECLSGTDEDGAGAAATPVRRKGKEEKVKQNRLLRPHEQ